MSSQLCWIHCNKCFEIFVRKKATFFLLSCAHILCQSCLDKCAIEKDQRQCSLCKKSIVPKKICPEMSPKYKRFFDTKLSQNTIDYEVLSFQAFHFKNLCKGICRAEQYLEETKNRIKEMYTTTSEMSKVFEELIQQTARWDAKIEEYKNIGAISEEYKHTNLNAKNLN